MAADHPPGSPWTAADVGTQLGPYKIEAAIGSGGMGEVFRAVDTRLGRKVAIKILPRNQVADAERKKRFVQEARAASALNHSNIVTLHDIASDSGVDYLVMELVEGESLDQLMLHQRLPVSEALNYAHQIAVGLAAAHAAGIVHRDIKPGNVIVTAESQVKILDFGLAKLTERFAGKESAMTEVGTVMGTIAYMSPEQVAAKPLDGRTDIFSLGVMLQEMLAGVQPFRGDSAVETMHAILHDSAPPLDAQPPELQEIVDKALAKEPKDRYQHVGDLALDLQRFQKASKANALPSMRAGPALLARGMSSRVLVGIAALATLATIGLGTLLTYQYRSVPQSEPKPALARFEISPPENTALTPLGAHLAVSPDGRQLAFPAMDAGGTFLLWVRPLDAVVARSLPGTEGASLPFWSPDSDWIGFFAQGKLKKVAAAGGPPQILADAPDGRGATWSPENVIVFSPVNTSPLSRVSASGGEAAVLTEPAQAQGIRGIYPSFLPDGRRFLYWREGSVYVGALDASDGQAVFMNPTPVVYADPGYLLFVRQSTLFAQRFDAATLAVAGDPVRIAESLMPSAWTGRTFSVSRSGVLIYRTLVEEDRQLAWFDRTGRQIELVGEPGAYGGVELSPDGSRIAVRRHEGRGGDIWVLEPRGTTTRLTFDATQDNSMPIWSPDGAQIVFASRRDGLWGLYRKASNGTGAEELLVESDVVKTPMAWAPDGNSIVYSVGTNATSDQWLLPLNGDREPTPLLDERFLEGNAQISPNGKWLAYWSSESGPLQVFVRPFPSGDGKWQVSNGGYFPRWSADGKEIFYLGMVPLGRVMAVTVNETGPTIERDTPQELFDSGFVALSDAGGDSHSYAVSPDGQRFLIPRPVSSFRTDGAPPSSPISVVLNWTALLEADRP